MTNHPLAPPSAPAAALSLRFRRLADFLATIGIDRTDFDSDPSAPTPVLVGSTEYVCADAVRGWMAELKIAATLPPRTASASAQ